jgi:hypothetical protein
MATKIDVLTAELKAINLWDRIFMDQVDPDTIDNDACTARMFRRAQLVAELHELSSRN